MLLRPGSTPKPAPGESSSISKVLKMRLGFFEDYTSMPVVAGIEAVVRSVIPRRGTLNEIREAVTKGELELALRPSIEAMRQPDMQVVPSSCAAVMGPSRLFMIYSNKLPTEINRVLVDAQDYGVTPIARLMIQRKLMISPEFIANPVSMEPGAFDFGSRPDVDAFLVTGKNNLFIRPSAFSFSLDLTQAWYEFTQLPFVVHCWVVRKGLKLGSVEKELTDLAKRNEGSRDIADRSAEKWGVSQSGVAAVYSKAFQTAFDARIVQSLRRMGQDLNQARILPIKPVSIYSQITAGGRLAGGG